MSSADLRVDGAESGETDGSAGSGPAEGSKDEDLERGKGTAVEGRVWAHGSGPEAARASHVGRAPKGNTTPHHTTPHHTTP